MRANLAALTLAAIAIPTTSAHYSFSKLCVNNVDVGTDWTYIRRHDKGYMPNKLADINSTDFRCQIGSMANAAKTEVYTVKGGDTIQFKLAFGGTTVKHPGPVQVYMSKAPNDNVQTYDGSGKWFKVHEAILCGDPSNGGILNEAWCEWMKNGITFKMPSNLPEGEYLVRVEHVALHGAHDNGVEFYFSCGQLKLSGTSGQLPIEAVDIPGVYKVDDKALHFSIWNNAIKEYKPIPGPDVIPGATITGSTTGNTSATVMVNTYGVLPVEYPVMANVTAGATGNSTTPISSGSAGASGSVSSSSGNTGFSSSTSTGQSGPSTSGNGDSRPSGSTPATNSGLSGNSGSQPRPNTSASPSDGTSASPGDTSSSGAPDSYDSCDNDQDTNDDGGSSPSNSSSSTPQDQSPAPQTPNPSGVSPVGGLPPPHGSPSSQKQPSMPQMSHPSEASPIDTQGQQQPPIPHGKMPLDSTTDCPEDSPSHSTSSSPPQGQQPQPSDPTEASTVGGQGQIQKQPPSPSSPASTAPKGYGGSGAARAGAAMKDTKPGDTTASGQRNDDNCPDDEQKATT